MDFSSQTLRPGEVVIWSAELEKQQHDRAIRPAPPIKEEHKPRMCREKVRKADTDVGEFRVSNPDAVRRLRQKWGL